MLALCSPNRYGVGVIKWSEDQRKENTDDCCRKDSL